MGPLGRKANFNGLQRLSSNYCFLFNVPVQEFFISLRMLRMLRPPHCQLPYFGFSLFRLLFQGEQFDGYLRFTIDAGEDQKTDKIAGYDFYHNPR